MDLGARSKELLLRALSVIALVVAATLLATGSAIARPLDPSTPDSSSAEARANTGSTPTTSSTPPPRLQGIDLVRARLADRRALSITVFGDDSSVGGTSWVHTWAQERLTAGRTVVYHAYNPWRRTYDAPLTLSHEGPRLDVWNASHASATSSSVAAELDRLDPGRSDVVIINLGHQEDPDTFTTDVGKLWTSLSARDAPLGLVMVQNPETVMADLQHTRMEHLMVTADQFGLPTVDVYAAFTASGRPLTSLVIGARPTPAGAAIWVDALTSALR